MSGYIYIFYEPKINFRNKTHILRTLLIGKVVFCSLQISHASTCDHFATTNKTGGHRLLLWSQRCGFFSFQSHRKESCDWCFRVRGYLYRIMRVIKIMKLQFDCQDMCFLITHTSSRLEVSFMARCNLNKCSIDVMLGCRTSVLLVPPQLVRVEIPVCSHMPMACVVPGSIT